MSSPAPRRRAAKPPSRWSRAGRQAKRTTDGPGAAARRRAKPTPERSARSQRRPRPAAGAEQVPPAGSAPAPASPPPAASAEPAGTLPAAPAAPVEPSRSRTSRARFLPLLACWVLVAAGVAAIGVAAAGIGPELLSRSGAVAISTAYVWMLAARTGGRPYIFSALTLAAGVSVVVVDRDLLTTGAAVMTCATSAVLAVMVTVPAVRFVQAAREAVIAVAVAAIGAVATVGFEPVVSLARFEYVTLALSLVGALGVVYRLGAGFHGLGRRGILTVLVGGLLLAGTLAYAELLRRYGTPGLVEWLFDGIRATRATLGAFPRPIEAVLGIPALTWGCHMRARRRQGWWVCAFGVAATAPVANALLNTTVTRTESGLAVLYALVVGIGIGFLLIRVDLALTAPRGSRGRRAEEATAIRPEPSRTSALL